MEKGLVIGGEFGSVLVRQRSGRSLELGELLVAESERGRMIVQVFDLLYGSQLSQQNLELVSGLKLEEDETLGIMDEKLRAYFLARIKSLALIQENKAYPAKVLPAFFSGVREIEESDVHAITQPELPLFLGKLRSGSRVLDVPVSIHGKAALSHHVLIAGTTGRGKSVFMTSLLWDQMGKDFAGMLVLDPHDEYGKRLADHPLAQKNLVYYTPKNAKSGQRTLRVNVGLLQPRHFDGVFDWSDAQRQALNAYFAAFRERWVEAVLKGEPVRQDRNDFHEATIAVVRRSLAQVLRLDVSAEGEISSRGVFDLHAGQSTVSDMVRDLEEGRTIIVDTSSFQGNLEILVGSIIATTILDRRKFRDLEQIKSGPVISIVVEEAPRVLGKDVLERGPNIFSTIAREGRKFGVGLVAITQLPSLIPREILANLNTKVILGIELRPERSAVIESASQDLSSDDRLIASLDKGEAIISSNFLPFAMPIKVIMPSARKEEARTGFSGVKLG